MILKKLSIINFKNIAQEEFEFSPGVNLLRGRQRRGQDQWSMRFTTSRCCKSSLPMSDAQNIRHGEEFFVLDGSYAADQGAPSTSSAPSRAKGARCSSAAAREYDRLADHVGLVPVVIVSPGDAALVSDAADERRRYLNGFVAQLDRAYLASVMRYNAVLAERNKLLKVSSDETMLAIYDRQLAEHGEAIHARRAEIVARLRPLVAEYYRRLSGDRECVELEYRSELNAMPMSELLLRRAAATWPRRFTTSGVHRDDLLLGIGAIRCANTARRAAEVVPHRPQAGAVCRGGRGAGREARAALRRPVRQTDAGRVEQLLALVADEAFGQIFITDCNPTRLRTILDRAATPYALFTVREGGVQR